MQEPDVELNYVSVNIQLDKLERELRVALRNWKPLKWETVEKYNSLVSKGKGYIDEVTL
jgi:hypothetical protein